jgi:hypothetical protein
MTMLTAINPKHQKAVNKAVKALMSYNKYNTLRDKASTFDDPCYKSWDRLCEKTFDKYLDIVSGLPKRERDNIEKSEIY